MVEVTSVAERDHPDLRAVGFWSLYLALLVLETLQHILWHSKLVRIPGEVALAVRVLDVQPDEVIGNVVLVKAGVDRLHVLLVVVVPPALVVTQRIDGREGLSA